MLKNRLAYLAALLTLVLLFVSYEADITYMALYTVLALPLLSLGLALLSKRRFTVTERITRDNIVKGEATQYVFSVRNNGFLPCTSVRVRFKTNSTAIVTDFADHFFSIGPYKSHEVVFNITARYRGNFEVGVLGITMYDFLGLFSFEQPHDKTLALTVRPRVLDILPLPLSNVESGMDQAKNLMAEEDYAIISDLRKYQPTDGYKKIHWKVSAKKNELISKNYQSTSRNLTSLLVDNSLIEAEAEEALVMEDIIMEGLVSALAYCTKRQQNCSLFYIGGEGNFGASGSFSYLYDVASGITFDRPGDFGTYFVNYSKMQVNAENIVVLTKNVGDEVFATAQTLRTLGNNVMIIYFEEPGDDVEKIARLNDLSIFCSSFNQMV